MRKEERESEREREGLRGNDDDNDILCDKNIQGTLDIVKMKIIFYITMYGLMVKSSTHVV